MRINGKLLSGSEHMILLCPICKQRLVADGQSYRCQNNHSFDISRKGAVNLLRSSGKGKHHGDDKRMVRARTDFLNQGYYDNLSNVICDMIASFIPEHSFVIDAGCGEGKYSLDVIKRIEAEGKSTEMLGVDISKEAISALRSRSKEIMGVVSSTASIPVPDSCADLLLNIFSPLFPKEFHRVLKSNGKMLRVIPQEKHLIELKEVVYEKAYLNPHDTGEVEEFEIKNKAEVNYKVDITNQNDIKALFQMTPYYYKTGEKDQNKLNDLDSLSITFSFGVFLYDRVGT